jgi:RHS repeat-associated protein
MRTSSNSLGKGRARLVRPGRSFVGWLTLVSFTGTTLSSSFVSAQTLEQSAAVQQAVAEGGGVERAQADPSEAGTSIGDVIDQANAAVDGRTAVGSSEESEETNGLQSIREQAAARDAVKASSPELDQTAAIAQQAANKVASLTSGADKSGVTSQAISVPKGAGKIDGMGESFSAQLSTGIASFSVPFAIPAARGGAQASLGLSYSSGSGPGLAGMGFSVGAPFIARQTDRGLPGYDDRSSFHPEQDRFVFNGGQELVPICTVNSGLACACTELPGAGCVGGALPDEKMPPWSEGHQYFRPRVEGSFLRFFWSPDHRTWRVQDKSGVTMELGVPLDGSNDTSGLEVNPDERREIYKWHLVRQYDTYGNANPPGATARPEPVNVCVYKYLQDGGMAYLTDVFHTTPAAEPTTTDTSVFAHHVRLDYEARTDPTFSYRSGFRMDQRLRLKRVDVTSKPFNGNQHSARRMVRRYHLGYEPGSHASLLASVQVEGRCGSGANPAATGPVSEDQTIVETGGRLPDRTSCPRLPPMTLGYSHVEPFTADGRPGASDLPGYEGFDERIRDIAASPTRSVDSASADLFDIDSDALPDMLVTEPGTHGSGHGVFFNSAGGQADRFGAALPMGIRGVLGASTGTINLSNLNVVPLDLDGDGRANLLHMPALREYSLYQPELLSGAWAWVGRAVETASGQNVKIDFGRDTLETQVADVNFDGLVDVVVSTGLEFQTFFSLGRFPGGDGQFGSAVSMGPTRANISNDPVRACVPLSGSPVRFSDNDTQIAEMNGDGIPDIVRLRRGDIRYWPGRGNGVWGTGRRDDCPSNTFADDRELVMEESPDYSDVNGSSLRIDDVNGDGLDDLVQVRYDAVDVWLNVDGVGWTRRHIIAGTPASPSFANRVRLVDVNGSGTRDILWGNADRFRYIDLQGGKQPLLLTRVENGLGKSTDIEYAASTEEMLRAEAHGGSCDATRRPWSSPWCSKMPTVAHVVKRVTESDNLVVGGSPASRYVTEYEYRDPVFEGRQREFRGFRKARAKRLGDANSPTDVSESTFLLGECKDETPSNGVDDCAVSERWRDNPREALKGLPVITEKYDEAGIYLSTEATTYRLRRLYVGLDGRDVRHAFETEKRATLYDTALGAASSASSIATPVVELELAPSAFDEANGDPLALPSSARVDETLAVPIRQPAGRAEIASRSVVDVFGNRVVAVARGCVAGSACPVAEPGLVPDETILSYTEPILPDDEQTGWLYRTGRSFVRGSVHTAARSDSTTTYTEQGDPERVDVALSGTLSLERSVTESLPITGSQDGSILISSRTYTMLGALEQESGANGRCRKVAYDAAYSALPTSEEIHRDGSGQCADQNRLVTSADYDRGLALPVVTTSMQGLSTHVDYDGFGRLSELRRPGDAANTRAEIASVRVEYFLPSPENPVKYSRVGTLTQDGPNTLSTAYLEAHAFVDGFGRTRATLAEAEVAGQWIAGGLETFDAKGAVARKYLSSYFTGDPAAFPFAVSPTTPYGRQRYDAFGRQVQTFDLDGTVTLQSRYHALSTDLFDAADIFSGPHQNTPATKRQDGHGRVISTTERQHIGRAIEERHTRTQYLPTGEPEVITRVRGAGTDTVTRWMRYDSLGRMVLNVEPNTSENFNADPGTDADSLEAWRYAYNDAGDLIGTSDARGCGQNFFYDGTGRLTAEDYAPCESLYHAAYTPPNPSTGAGFEVLYVHDGVAVGLLPGFVRPPGYDSDSPFLRGRLAAVFSRGSVAFTTYDFLGRAERADVRVARPNQNLAGFETRYADRWFSKDFAYDAADREIASTTGATAAALQGTPQSAYGFPASRASSVVTTDYTARGTVNSVGGSYGALVTSIKRTADGLIEDIVYGDVAGTTTAFKYDDRRRVRNVTTFRGEPPLWSSPPTDYQPPPAPTSTTSFQLLLQDEDFTYDVVNNPTEIRDWRIPEEWPAGAKPVTRKMQYDDLYRLTRIEYEYSTGDDAWTSPFAADLGVSSDPRRAEPSPHVSFQKRILRQDYAYDWLGNTAKTTDDAHGFYDRSLGSIENDGANDKPYQLRAATNEAFGGTRTGTVGARYDAAGNLTRLDVKRNGACLGASQCSQRFEYRWDEVGRLVRAKRWDVAASAITVPDAPLPNDAEVDADLEYGYDASDERILKTARDGGDSVHTVYVFDSLELRRARFEGSDYTTTVASEAGLTETEVPYLFAHGVRLARVVYGQDGDGEPRLASSGQQHVFFELGDHLGSTSVVLDKATSELVERASFQAYGAKESDYRPERWKGFREDYGFTGKEEDVEVGLQYFGKRFLSPYLGRWASADPLTVHALGGDLNVHAYVSGAVLKNTDPLGLCSTANPCTNDSTGGPAGNEPEAKDRPSSTPEPPQRKMEAGPETGSRGTNSGQPTPAPAPTPERPNFNLPPNIGGRGAPADESQNYTKRTELNTIEIAAIVITIAPPGTFARVGAGIGAAVRGVGQSKKARDMAAMESAIAESKALAETPAATEGVLAGRAVPNPGGRLGKPETRALNRKVGDDLEADGFEVVGGGDRLPEEFIPGPGGGTKGSAWVDTTARKGDDVVRVQTVDTTKRGIPTPRELRNAGKILKVGDNVTLVPK